MSRPRWDDLPCGYLSRAAAVRPLERSLDRIVPRSLWQFRLVANATVAGRGALRDRTAAAAGALATELERAGAVCPGPDVAEPDPVVAAIRDLPELEQEIVTMLIWDDLAPREVAAVLGLTPNVVRVRAHRARAKLKAALANEDPGGEAEPELSLSLPPPPL